MNPRGFAFLMALLIAVQLTTFTWAAQNLTKTSGKDYDEQGKHPGEQPVRSIMEEQCTLEDFSLGGRKPVFPEKPGLTFPICQDNHYATFYDNEWGIARYAVYKITSQQAKAARVPRQNDYWRLTKMPDLEIRQGRNELYKEQSQPPEYDKGHIVPFKIFAYSPESARATYTYTNCVPQNSNFNRGQWKTYEEKIDSYSYRSCSEEGDTLYLITGTSQVKFGEELKFQGGITGVSTSVQQMKGFPDVPVLGGKIAIPNSMWTVGCCWNDYHGVVGAFGVMGTNSLDKPLNEFMMPKQSVAYVEGILKLEYKHIKLFPWPHANGCYAPGNNVELIKVPSL